MDSRRAKDFLVEEAARQAAIEGIALSGLEKRMMYFTEGRDAVEDPVALNEEFEAKYEMEEYEAKVSQLLKHAHARLRSQSPASLQTWNEAVATLREGDHYILVMIGAVPWIPVAKVSIRLVVPIAVVVGIILLLRSRFGALSNVSPYVFFAAFVGVYLLALSMSRGRAPEPLARIGKAIAAYLFGK